MTIDQLKAVAADPCINLSGLVADAGVSRVTIENYIKDRRGKYGIKKEVSDKLDAALNRLNNRICQPPDISIKTNDID